MNYWPMETRLPCGDQWKAEKLGAFWRWPITRCFIKSDRAGLIIDHSINKIFLWKIPLFLFTSIILPVRVSVRMYALCFWLLSWVVIDGVSSNWMLTLKRQSRLQQTTFINIFSLFFRENKTWCFKRILCLAEDSLETSSLIWHLARQRIHLKQQALFSSTDKSTKLKCRLLQLLFGALRVNMSQVYEDRSKKFYHLSDYFDNRYEYWG